MKGVDVNNNWIVLSPPEVAGVGYMHGDLKPMNFVLDTNVLHELGHLQLGQLGHVQEYQQALAKYLRSLALHLDDIDSLARVAGSFAAVEVVFDCRDTARAELPPIQPNLCAPSLHLPLPQVLQVVDGHMTWEELCAILEQIPQTGTAAVVRAMRREIRWATVVIAILSALIFWAVPFFCSLRWERRRWFLCHGARPPKPRPQAMLSLFAGACSRPSFAT